jgi:hypothetical protein
MCIDFFILFGQVRGNLINEDRRSQGVAAWCTVNMFSLVQDPTDFLTDRS